MLYKLFHGNENKPLFTLFTFNYDDLVVLLEGDYEIIYFEFLL